MVFVWAGGKPGATEPPRLPLPVGGGQLGKELSPRAKHIDSGLLIFFPLPSPGLEKRPGGLGVSNPRI